MQKWFPFLFFSYSLFPPRRLQFARIVRWLWKWRTYCCILLCVLSREFFFCWKNSNVQRPHEFFTTLLWWKWKFALNFHRTFHSIFFLFIYPCKCVSKMAETANNNNNNNKNERSVERKKKLNPVGLSKKHRIFCCQEIEWKKKCVTHSFVYWKCSSCIFLSPGYQNTSNKKRKNNDKKEINRDKNTKPGTGTEYVEDRPLCTDVCRTFQYIKSK